MKQSTTATSGAICYCANLIRQEMLCVERELEVSVLRAEFEAVYCDASRMRVEEMRQHRVALPCICDAVDGVHWAMVDLRPSAICDHLTFYSPTKDQLIELGSQELRAELDAGRRGCSE